MYSIAADLEGLTNICELDVLQTSNQRVITLRVEEYCCTILVWQGVCRITSELDVSREQSNFRSHVNEVSTIPLDLGKVLELQSLL